MMTSLCINASTLLVATIAFFVAFLYLRRKRQNLPPGPTPLPFLGNLIAIGRFKDIKEALHKYRQDYGDIFTIYMGSHPIIVLCRQQLIREALVGKAEYFSDRPQYLKLTLKIFGENGIVFDPHKWRLHRRLTMMAVKDGGVGKQSGEERTQEEVRALFEELQKLEGEVVDMRIWLSKATANITISVLLGQRIEYDNPKFTRLIKLVEHAVASLGDESAIIDFMPYAEIIPKIKAQVKESFSARDEIMEFIKENVEEHKKDFDGDNLRDLIDIYLKHNPDYDEVTCGVVKEIFHAGGETSGTTLTWIILIMAKYPEIQKRCFKEIKEAVGLSRITLYSERKQMPFVEATILETMRRFAIFPVSLPHALSDDLHFAGYDLKKGLMVIPFLDSCLHDPEVWPDHDEFRPERWLDKSGKLGPTNTSNITFGLGRRVCVGEQLARIEMFVILAGLLQQFEFFPASEEPVSLEGHLGITFCPVHPQVKFRKRDS